MERVANVRLFGWGARVLGVAAIFAIASCGGGDGGGTGGAGGHAGKTGGGGHAGSVTGTGGHGTGGLAGGAGGRGGTGGSAGSTAGTGGGGTAGGGAAGGGAAGGGATGSAGMDGGADASADAAADAGSPDAGNNGATCTANTDCTSNACVDGVCCEAACAGSCMACSNTKTGQANGLCRPVKAATDPDDECTATAQTGCGLDGVCDGAGACRKWVAGTTCAPESCSGSIDTPTRTCDGAGTCRTVTNTSCGGYLCGATSCKTSCSASTECALGNNCIGGHCTPPQQMGSACSVATDCVSGNCVDGLCCDQACAGSCMACSHAKTSVADGTCAPIVIGTDPDNECAGSDATSCGMTGMCNGAGACALWPAGTTCAGGTCSAGNATPPRTCDGAGTCQAATASSCGAYMCGASACQTSCGTTADCASGYFCSGGACVPAETIGTACTANSECGSGFCVDGVCCNNACQGTCQSCAVIGSVGTCTAVAAGSDPRNDCAPDAASTCGKDGTCDGAGACRKYVAGTLCKAAGCASGSVSAASTCDGAGTCNAGAQTSCNPFQCNTAGTACLTSCTTDASCSGFCAAGTCVSSPVNLAGNGDVEFGSTIGWTSNGGTSKAATGTGLAHTGSYSLEVTNRSQNYQGPTYPMPSGAGTYTITAWAMQQDNPTQPVGLQVQVNCGSSGTTASYLNVGFPTLNAGEWTKITGTVDLSTGTDCNPAAATPGSVTSAVLYLNQNGSGSTVAFPNLFLDDVVIQATDGHNLIGDPNFESGSTGAWQNNGGGALAVTTAVAHTGTHSLAETSRTQTYNGPHWDLPIGPAKYNVSISVQHNAALAKTLMLQPTYTCKGGNPNYPSAVGYTQNIPPNTWTTLSGTVTFPPADAPAGCQLAAAAIYVQQQGETGNCGTDYECPDLFIDDASITLAQ